MINKKTKRYSHNAATPNFRWTAVGHKPAPSHQRYSRPASGKSNNRLSNSGVHSRVKLITVVVVSIIAVIGLFEGNFHNASAAIPEIRSGISGYCLDAHHNGTTSNTEVDSWICNDTFAQNWTLSGDNIKHGISDCLDVQDGATSVGSDIILDNCNGSSRQMWTPAVNGYENINSGLCLAIPNSQTGAQLTLESCGQLAEPSEMWIPATSSDNNSGNISSLSCNNGSEGYRVACYAEQQWSVWQSGSINHNTLLNDYSDGNGYEEWCADFVSYIYQEAGYPFTQGERNGWDEYNANNIQNMGFTEHSATDYQPKAGDVAFFDYSGGHVEIVAVGGEKPIFIYGDSATVDPSTGNGDMAENSKTSDGSLGQVVYYLSPN